MLFNSLSFLLGFIPLTFGGFFLIGKRNHTYAVAWLAIASLVFYAWWLPAHTLILLISICFNYVMGLMILRAANQNQTKSRKILIFSITLNLLALGYYKYAGFFVETATNILGYEWQVPKILLPLGISFFTFTQLAYLIDTYQQKVREANFLRYLLFVTYFPHLIAGPVIHHKDVMPQFEKPSASRWSSVNVAAGIGIFFIGLFKKVVIADGLAPYVATIFDASNVDSIANFTVAWGAVLAYTFQLYFDFSGYSDMAIGLSLALNVRLPFNFNSPYKARSIIEFWTRWHISLSTFLRDYLYIPLGGNRRGILRRFLNLFLTMLIGGMWHGAGWTFIVWGSLHGAFLIINHSWRKIRQEYVNPVGRLESIFYWIITFLSVISAWVFFRSHNLDDAWRIIEGLLGLHGIGTLSLIDAKGDSWNYSLVYLASIVLVWVVVAMPNSQEIVMRWLVRDGHLAFGAHKDDSTAWRYPGWAITLALGVAASISLMHLSQPTVFLYFNF